jgi:hypothetical protein
VTVRGEHERRGGPDAWVRAARLTLAAIFALALVLTIARIASLST